MRYGPACKDCMSVSMCHKSGIPCSCRCHDPINDQPSAEEPKKFWYVLGLLTRFDSKNEAISAARFQAKGCPTARYVVMESLCEVVMPKAEPVVLWMK